jgi:hypothetical protein
MALGLSQLSYGAQSAGVVSGKNIARSNGVMISSARAMVRSPICLPANATGPLPLPLVAAESSSIAAAGAMG